MAIGTYEVDSLKFNNVPQPDYFPVKYVNTGHSILNGFALGRCYIFELNGKPFTETFIYGSFNGEVTFSLMINISISNF